MTLSDDFTYGPVFRWFAWHPVWTEDRGWRWLRLVHRRRCYPPEYLSVGSPFWATTCTVPDGGNFPRDETDLLQDQP